MMTAEKAKELEEKRVQFGLSEEAAQKIIKGAQNQNVIANMNVSPCKLLILWLVRSGVVCGNEHDNLRKWK